MLVGPGQRHRHRDQPGLGTVVQIAFDPLQSGRRIVDNPGAGLFQLGHASLPLGGTEQRARQPDVGAADAQNHPAHQIQRDYTCGGQQDVRPQRIDRRTEGDDRLTGGQPQHGRRHQRGGRPPR